MNRLLTLMLWMALACTTCWAQETAPTREAAPVLDVQKFSEEFRVANSDERYAILKRLGGMGEAAVPAVPFVARVMLEPRMEANLRYEAAATLWKLGDVAKDAVPALITALDDGDPHLRGWAAYALGSIVPVSKDAVAKLRLCLRDEKSGVVRNAAQALGSIGSDAAQAESDLEGLQQAQDEGLRRAAATALKQIRVARAAP